MNALERWTDSTNDPAAVKREVLVMRFLRSE
jgi:hypothetical protein